LGRNRAFAFNDNALYILQIFRSLGNLGIEVPIGDDCTGLRVFQNITDFISGEGEDDGQENRPHFEYGCEGHRNCRPVRKNHRHNVGTLYAQLL
jgi:hypothetical protein